MEVISGLGRVAISLSEELRRELVEAPSPYSSFMQQES